MLNKCLRQLPIRFCTSPGIQNPHCSVCQEECKQERKEQRCGWPAKHGGMLILLRGIVAHKVDGVLPYVSPHVHSWTHVHGTAHSVGGCPDQLYKEGNKRMSTQAIAEFDGHSGIQKSEPPSSEPRVPVSLFFLPAQGSISRSGWPGWLLVERLVPALELDAWHKRTVRPRSCSFFIIQFLNTATEASEGP